VPFPSDRTCRSSFIIRSIREAGEEARELLSAEAGYRCEIGESETDTWVKTAYEWIRFRKMPVD
jgi:hypothetical protein